MRRLAPLSMYAKRLGKNLRCQYRGFSSYVSLALTSPLSIYRDREIALEIDKVSERSTTMKRIYNTDQWKKTRRLYLSLHPLCEVCLKMDRITPASQVDHIQAIEDGGAPFDMDNLMALCLRHHSRKTALRDRGFGNRRSKKPVIPGCGTDGLPIDPGHHWNGGA